jgi:hypothetical protein
MCGRRTVRGNTLSGVSQLAFGAFKKQRIEHDECKVGQSSCPAKGLGKLKWAMRELHEAKLKAQGEKRDG